MKCINCGKLFTKNRPRCKAYEGFVSFTFSCIKCYYEECPETFNDESTEAPVNPTREWVLRE